MIDMIENMIKCIENFLSAPWWVGVGAIVAILALFPRVREKIIDFLSAPWRIGVIAIVAILALFLIYSPPVPEERVFAIPGGESVKMVWIEPDTFDMGCVSERDCQLDETPVHSVSISEGFWMGKYEVTQGQWKAVMGTTPWHGKRDVRSGSDYPAVYISWHDAQGFIHQLNVEAGSNVYRLPTEAEWEYACRAGTSTRWSFGDDESQLRHYAWYDSNAKNIDENYAHKVGEKRANPWGLYDMHGNVWEWGQEWYHKDYYSVSPQKDPPGARTGTHRVVRGGGFYHNQQGTRSADRSYDPPDTRNGHLGFRLLRRAD